jgi:hypothetical protein
LSGPDEFDRLVGERRGLTDARDLAEQLARAQRQLTGAQLEARSLRSDNEALQEDIEALHRDVFDLEVALTDDVRDLDAARRDWRKVRYLAMRHGLPDLMPGGAQHEGVWTGPRRCYLAFTHVFHPTTGDCFQAGREGVGLGRLPGRSLDWWRCSPDRQCPEPPPLPDLDQAHPTVSGLALRQSRRWWDNNDVEWRISRDDADPSQPCLSDGHLLGVLDWLEDRLALLWGREHTRLPSLVPAPPEAFATAAEFLHSTPLYCALIKEKRQRRLRRPRRDMSAKEPRPAWLDGLGP